MRIFFLFLLGISCSSIESELVSDDRPAAAMFVSGVRYLDPVFTSTATLSNVVYAGDVWNPYKGISETLKFDVYRPKNDTAQSRWSIVFIYGGGFWTNSKTSPASNVSFCKDLALRGYVVFAIEYRKFASQTQFGDSLKIVNGTPMAGSDLRAAIRFIRANATLYKIDPVKITTYGGSSGGFTSMAAAYWEEIDTLSIANLANIGWPSSPNLAAETSAGLPVAAVNEIEFGEVPGFFSHCTGDPLIPISYSQSCYDRAVSVGVDATSWWMAGSCHGMIDCCKASLLANLCGWIYSELN